MSYYDNPALNYFQIYINFLLVSAIAMSMPRLLEYNSDNEDEVIQFELDIECGTSPHRTRSGRVYTDLVDGGKRKRRIGSVKKTTQWEAAGHMGDCEENNDEDSAEETSYK